jgi:hypothetical protein
LGRHERKCFLGGLVGCFRYFLFSFATCRPRPRIHKVVVAFYKPVRLNMALSLLLNVRFNCGVVDHKLL